MPTPAPIYHNNNKLQAFQLTYKVCLNPSRVSQHALDVRHYMAPKGCALTGRVPQTHLRGKNLCPLSDNHIAHTVNMFPPYKSSVTLYNIYV